MPSVLDFLYKILVTGALSKGWGGPQCRAALDIKTHIIESSVWLTFGVFAFIAYKAGPKFRALVKSIQLDLLKSTPTTAARTFELFMATIHFGMFIQIIYYKVNILSLVNMIQPCHVILLLQGIALYSTGTTGVVISLCVLPSLTGTTEPYLPFIPNKSSHHMFLEALVFHLKACFIRIHHYLYLYLFSPHCSITTPSHCLA